MAIPKYEAQPYKPDFLTEQVGDYSSQAEAQGQANLASQYKGLSNVYNRQAAASVTDLAQRLQQFNDLQEKGMNTAVGMVQWYAQDQGVKEAQSDLVQMNDEIRKIQNNPEIEPQAKIDQINDVRLKLQDDLSGMYGEAYNNTVKADFNNQVSVEATKMAADISKLANGDPLKFKELWGEYTDKSLKFAPDDASRLIQGRIYDKVGMNTFSGIAKASARASSKIAKENSKLAEKNLKNLYINRLQVGDIGSADEIKIQYYKKVQSDVEGGHISPEVAAQRIRDFDTEGFITSNRYKFDQAVEQGGGVPYFEAFKKKMGSLDFNLYDPKKIQAHRNYMESALQNEFKKASERVKSSLDNGVKPPIEDVNRMMKFSAYGDPEELKKINIALAASEILQENKNLPLSEQQENLEPPKSGDSVEVQDVKKEIKKQTENRQTKAAKDPVKLAEDEGIVLDPVTIVPGEKLDELQRKLTIRSSQAEIARQKYDTVEPKFLKEDEVKEITSFLKGPANVKDKINFIKSFDVLPKFQREMINNQIDKDDKLLGQVQRVMKDGRDNVAAMILEGQKYINQPFFTETKKDLKTEITKEIQTEMLINPAEAQRLQDSITSLYAYLAVQDPDTFKDGLDDDILKQSINTILGEKGDKGYAPPGVVAGDFNDWFSWVSGDNWFPSNEAGEGDIPNVKGATAVWQTQRKLEDSYPIRIEGNKYMFLYRGKLLQGQDGKVYTLDYKKVK